MHNVQTAVMVMLADSSSAQLTPVTTATNDLGTVQATDTTPLALSSYMAGLDAGGKVKSGCTCTFTADGTVTRSTP